MTIGVFDSGVGGRSVANAIKKALPNHEIIYKQDRKNVPYGNKTPNEMMELTLPILQDMVDEGCAVIVIACNSVTTNCIETLRQKISVPLVGIEPMIKPAAQLTRGRVIVVCATTATLKSHRYQYLKNKYAESLRVIEPDCSAWAAMVERNVIDQKAIERIVTDAVSEGADVIVLGCTHYHWIEEKIEKLSKGKAIILQPEEAVITQLSRVIARLD